MRATTTILAYVIAFAAVAFIAAGVWDLSTLRADTGEMLEPSDYTPGIQTIADGLVIGRDRHDRRPCDCPPMISTG
jgi:hypothetical protein